MIIMLIAITLTVQYYISDCPSKTYGIGCQNCSINCRDAECLKTSETMECMDGCEAGYKGNDCSLSKCIIPKMNTQVNIYKNEKCMMKMFIIWIYIPRNCNKI